MPPQANFRTRTSARPAHRLTRCLPCAVRLASCVLHLACCICLVVLPAVLCAACSALACARSRRHVTQPILIAARQLMLLLRAFPCPAPALPPPALGLAPSTARTTSLSTTTTITIPHADYRSCTTTTHVLLTCTMPLIHRCISRQLPHYPSSTRLPCLSNAAYLLAG
jgi:hypothetical protein